MQFAATKIYLVADAVGSHDVKEQNSPFNNLFGDKCPASIILVAKRSARAGEREPLLPNGNRR
jgi:hypothetical protein